MKTIEVSLAQIGNSRGIRLTAKMIRRHGLENGVLLEDRGHEIALRPIGGPRKLSWEETAREMAAASEDWTEWGGTLSDGLEEIPWISPMENREPAGRKPKRVRKK